MELAHEWWYYLLFPLLLCTFKGSIQFRIFSLIALVAISLTVTRFILLLYGVWLIGVAARRFNNTVVLPWYVSLTLFTGGAFVMRVESLLPGIVSQFLLGTTFLAMLEAKLLTLLWHICMPSS